MWIGGGEKVVSQLATGLDHNTYETVVCCIKEKGTLGENLEIKGVPVYTLCHKGQKRNFTSAFKLAKLLRKEDIVILHSHGMPALFDGAISSLLWQVPIYLHTFHFGNYPFLRRRRYFWGEKLCSKIPEFLVAVSNQQREKLIYYYNISPNRITTIHNGVEENLCVGNKLIIKQKRDELKIHDGVIVIGTVGVLSKQKGIKYLLDAARVVVKSVRNVKFVIVGDGRLKEELERKTEDLNLQEHVLFTGYRNDINDLLLAFDVFIMSSLWEGLPLALLEAMAAGKPIVSTNVGDNSQIIDDGASGYLVPPGDSEKLADAILKIVNDKSKISTMGDVALKIYRNNFNAQKMVQNYSELYEKYLARLKK